MFKITRGSEATLLPFATSMLADRYLLKNETPQDMFERVSCAYADNQEHAQRLYGYISKLWFMPATPILANGGTERGLPISCLATNTPVITINGCKNIQDIQIGDLVLTHKGRFKKVINTKKSQSSDIYELQASIRTTKLQITGNHLVYTNRGWVRVDELNPICDFIATNEKIINTENKDYYINVDNCNNIIESGKFARTIINNNVLINEDLAWALGFWFAQGSSSKNGVLRVTHNAIEPCIKWCEIMSKAFNVNNNAHQQRTWFNGDVYSKTLTEYFDKIFGKGSRNKSIPTWLIDLPVSHLKEFYDGLYLGDGFKTSVNKAVELSNQNLIAGISIILSKIGIKHTMQLKKKSVYKKELRYNGIITESNTTPKKISINGSGISFADGLCYGSIKQLEKLNTSAIDVYDLEVEEDNSFSAAGVVVHNCFLNEVPDSMAGIAGTFHENTFLASGGGGIGTCWSNVRSINESIKDRGTSSGIIPFLKTQDSYTLAISQGCYDDQTEILTEKGFIKFEDLKKYDHSLKVAQVAEDAESFEFVQYTDFIKYQTSECLYSFKNTEAQTNLFVTGNHRMATQNIKKVNGGKQWNKKCRIVEADKLSCNRDVRFINAVPKKNGKKHFLTPLERFLIAYQADGSTAPSGSSNGNVSGSKIYSFHFKKQRKIDRLENILNEGGLYHTKSFGKDNDTTFCVRVPNAINATKNFNEWVNITNITQEWAVDFIEELKHWDGSEGSDNSITYSTVDSKNADLTQVIGIIAGYKTKLLKQTRDITRQDLYRVYFVKNSRYTSAEKITPEKKHYNGFVYCVTVPTGLLIVRRCGAVTICGNSLRRGSSAAYLDISHPEIEEFIDIRRPTGGDPNRRSLNLHHGVCVSDAFMQAVQDGATWELKSPVDGKVTNTVEARDLWIKILNARIETGEPYILYTGNVDKNRSLVYEANGLKCKTSNLCSEIMLTTGLDYQDKERTAVCCLSSLNLEHYDEWKGNTLFIEDIYRFLDNVLEDFIKRAPDSLQNAKYSAMMERSVGLGVMGFHSFLQKKNTPIEGVAAKSWNRHIFRHIRYEADEASKKLADEKGSCPDAERAGIKARFSNLLAVAPTASISIIANSTSPAIEPLAANCFTQKTLSGSFTVKNQYLEKLLTEKGKNGDKVWSSIALNEGSVQHLDFLTPEEKDVFKTAIEINQKWLIEHAADRQEFIDQGQSLNLFVPANISKKELHDLHFSAWKKGVKSLYYCRSVSLQHAEKAPVSIQEKPIEVPVKKPEYDECLACQ